MMRLSAITAVLFYVLAVIVGGLLTPGYSHLYNSISELTVSSATHPLIISLFFGLYNLLLLACGVMGYRQTQSLWHRISFVAIDLIAILGALMFFFPQDPRSALLTTAGLIHLILAGIISISTILAASIAGVAFFKESHYKHAYQSWFFSMGIFITGILTAFGLAHDSPIGGLYERLVVGTFLIWIIWYACNFAKSKLTDI